MNVLYIGVRDVWHFLLNLIGLRKQCCYVLKLYIDNFCCLLWLEIFVSPTHTCLCYMRSKETPNNLQEEIEFRQENVVNLTFSLFNFMKLLSWTPFSIGRFNAKFLLVRTGSSDMCMYLYLYIGNLLTFCSPHFLVSENLGT